MFRSWLLWSLWAGVVFGDIGTSPLYTFNSIFTEGGCFGFQEFCA